MKSVKVTYTNNPSNLDIKIIDLNGRHYSEVTSIITSAHSFFQPEFELIDSNTPTHRIEINNEGFGEIICLNK